MAGVGHIADIVVGIALPFYVAGRGRLLTDLSHRPLSLPLSAVGVKQLSIRQIQIEGDRPQEVDGVYTGDKLVIQLYNNDSPRVPLAVRNRMAEEQALAFRIIDKLHGIAGQRPLHCRSIQLPLHHNPRSRLIDRSVPGNQKNILDVLLLREKSGQEALNLFFLPKPFIGCLLPCPDQIGGNKFLRQRNRQYDFLRLGQHTVKFPVRKGNILFRIPLCRGFNGIDLRIERDDQRDDRGACRNQQADRHDFCLYGMQTHTYPPSFTPAIAAHGYKPQKAFARRSRDVQKLPFFYFLNLSINIGI